MSLPSSSSSPGSGQQSLGVVLIVEDNVMIAMDVEAQLEDLGTSGCVIAGTVENALHALDARDIAFAIVDVDLGNETSEEVAAALIARSLPFAFVTGYGEAVPMMASFPEVPVLLKPFTSDALQEMLVRIGVG